MDDNNKITVELTEEQWEDVQSALISDAIKFRRMAREETTASDSAACRAVAREISEMRQSINRQVSEN